MFVLSCAALLCLAGGAQADTRLQSNEAAARHDARHLLELLKLPHDVTSSATRPRVGGSLIGEPSANGRFWAGDQAYWTTSANPHAIIAYVEAHLPAGSSLAGTGSSSGGSTSSLSVMLGWPALGLRVFNRTMTVSVVSSSQGHSAIVARSQSYWMYPRASGEQVPGGVHAIAVTLRIGGGPEGLKHQRIRTYPIWRAARVARIVSEFDSLPIVQPGVAYSCPAIINGIELPLLTLSFKSGEQGPVLARADVQVSPGRHGASGWNGCDPIDFWIGGRRQTPLTSRTFVKRIGRLIGVDIS